MPPAPNTGVDAPHLEARNGQTVIVEDAQAPAKETRGKPGAVGATMEVFTGFSDDDGMTQAAALAFYTGLSLAPLLSIGVWLTQLFLGEGAKDQIITWATQIVGSQGAKPVQELLKPASEQAQVNMNVTGILSIIFLAFTASGVLGQLQSSLNIMWNVKTDPNASGWLILIKKRLFSFGMLFTLLFLLLVSMAASVAVEAAVHLVGGSIPIIARVLNIGVTFAVATGIFMLLFTYLPDVRVPWRDTLFGAALTAVLFLVGRYAMGVYLGRGSYETSYGTAIGSFVALLVWVYYTSIIIFIGVEATQVWARRHGHEPRPERHAVKVERVERTLRPTARTAAT